MNTKILLLLIIFIPHNLYFNEEIKWSASNKLQWDNFQGKPQMDNEEGASCSIGIGYGAKYNNTRIKFNIYSIFYPNESWTLSNSIDLLNHEQRHFDIQEYHARMFRQMLQERITNIEDLDYKIERFYAQIDSLNFQMQNVYDKETSHSRNIVQQKKWDKKIDSLLRATSKYSKEDFSVGIVKP